MDTKTIYWLAAAFEFAWAGVAFSFGSGAYSLIPLAFGVGFAIAAMAVE